MVSNIGAEWPHSFEPDTSSDEENKDAHGSSRLQWLHQNGAEQVTRGQPIVASKSLL